MNRKSQKRKFAGKRKACPELAAFIIWRCKLKGITQKEIGAGLGVSRELVHGQIWGRKTSRRVREGIARALGYEDWQTLIQASRGVAV